MPDHNDDDQPQIQTCQVVEPPVSLTRSQHRRSVKVNIQDYDSLFRLNAMWAAQKIAEDPDYFINMNKIQTPTYLWIGCSDSRVPANDIAGLQPGELFVQRNIANLVISSDINVQSVIAYAVCHLKVRHILVVGHYNCGGVKHALEAEDCGFLNAWLTNIQDVCRIHSAELGKITSFDEKFRRVVELNVLESCHNVAKNAFVQASYAKNRFPIINGLVYDLATGYLKDLQFDFGEHLRSQANIFRVQEK